MLNEIDAVDLPWLYLLTGHPVPQVCERFGDYPVQFDTMLDLAASQRIVCDVAAGQTLPDPHNLRAVIVSGSMAIVTDQQPWMRQTAAWLREAVENQVCPILAICFGHQLLATCLGGVVEQVSNREEYGTIAMRRTSAGAADPLFSELPDLQWQQHWHRQSVTVIPPNAQALATTDADPHTALRLGRLAWSVQFHPERTGSCSKVAMEGNRQKLEARGLDVDAINRRTVDHGHGQALGKAFRRMVTQMQAV